MLAQLCTQRLGNLRIQPEVKGFYGPADDKFVAHTIAHCQTEGGRIRVAPVYRKDVSRDENS